MGPIAWVGVGVALLQAGVQPRRRRGLAVMQGRSLLASGHAHGDLAAADDGVDASLAVAAIGRAGAAV